MKFFSLSAVLCTFVYKANEVNSHSWVECTHYDKVINGQDYDAGACLGYTRSWADYNSQGFADDRGNNYQGSNGAWCGNAIGSPDSYDDTYTDAYPMAEYVTGGTYRIVWPAKNHANYECFSNIPDKSMKLFMNPNVNPTSDLADLDDWVEVWDWQDGCTPEEDGCGFQNCPDFCDDTDGAVCYGDFTLDNSTFFAQGSGMY